MGKFTKCSDCGKPAPCHWYCDNRNDGPWCDDCFVGVGCLENHGEGCATKVFEDESDG